MKPALFALVSSLAVLSLPDAPGAATIGWGCHSDAGITDYDHTFLTGIRYPGGPPDLSRGPLVQLMRQNGGIDNHLVTDPAAVDWVDPDYILDESHIGYGFGPPGAPMETGAWFAANRVVDINPGDVLYVRAFNLPKSDITPASVAILSVTVSDCPWGSPVTKNVTQVMNPENYYFDNLTMVVPEPATLLFVLPGLAIWALRRKAVSR